MKDPSRWHSALALISVGLYAASAAITFGTVGLSVWLYRAAIVVGAIWTWTLHLAARRNATLAVENAKNAVQNAKAAQFNVVSAAAKARGEAS